MRKSDPDSCGETGGHFLILTTTPLLLNRLVPQKVTTIWATTHDLARTGHFEAFANRLIGLTHRKRKKMNRIPLSVNQLNQEFFS